MFELKRVHCINLKRAENRKSINRIVLLVILNAAVGIFLKSFLIVRPIFTIYYQIWFIQNGKVISRSDYVSTCQSSYFCSTIDTIGRNFMLINLTIPFFFFYKFDIRFKECLQNLVKIFKKKLKQRRQKI